MDELSSFIGVKRGVVQRDELFRIFVRNKEHNETVAVTLRNQHTKIQSILSSIVHRKNGWAQDRYFLINDTDEQILNPERTLMHYNIASGAKLILTRKNFRGFKSMAASVSSKAVSRNGKAKEKLTIICNFGAPYNKQKLVSSYFADASLDLYAPKLKEKFGMPPGTVIIFRNAKFGRTPHGAPFLGRQRKCGLKELDIHANDEVLAQTKGVNITLKPFHAPKDSKVVEMFSCFSLRMLRDQIEKELGIALKDQRWLIRSGGRLVRTDKDCGAICEYEIITILGGCGCEGRPHCGHSVSAMSAVAPPSTTHPPTVQTQSPCLTHFGPSPAYAQTPLQSAVLPAYAQSPMMTVMAPMSPTVPSPMCAMDPKFPQYANLGNYAKWAPLVYGDYVSAYSNYNANFEVGEQKDFDGYEFEMANAQQFEFGRTANVEMGRSLKPCRNGNQCRFFLNPHISGPCHFYHPPTTPTPITNTMCMPAKTTNAAKRRRRRSRAKIY